jgi:hypothetical protein
MLLYLTGTIKYSKQQKISTYSRHPKRPLLILFSEYHPGFPKTHPPNPDQSAARVLFCCFNSDLSGIRLFVWPLRGQGVKHIRQAHNPSGNGDLMLDKSFGV